MSQLPFVATTNKICEAHGCDNRATVQIEVHVGKFGTIPLSLCIDCISSNNPKKMIGVISHQPIEGRTKRSKLIPKQTTHKELL
jgi:hypothetical protein